MPAEHTLYGSSPAIRATLSGSTFGQRREDIFNRLKNSAEQCQRNYGEKRELATERDESVFDLCEALEECFSYGLHQQHANVIVTAASLLQNMHEIVRGGTNMTLNSTSCNNNDIMFWDFCQVHLIPHERERFEKLKHIWTKLGKGRAFIRAALNENSLHGYVLTWLSDVTELQRFYTPWSLLLNEEAAKMIPEIVGSLKDVLFALNFDTIELNAPKRNSNTSSTPPKEEPIIYAPNPVPITNNKQKRKINAVERPIVSANSTEDLLGALKPKESVEVKCLLSKEIMSLQDLIEPAAEVYTTPVDPIGPELEFLKKPLPDIYEVDKPPERSESHSQGSISSVENELYNEDRSDTDTSSQYSKSSNSANQSAMQEQIRSLTERCALLETRVAELSLQNRQLVRRLTVQFNETGIDPSSSLCANFLITIPSMKLIKSPRGTSSYYTYEIHITMRQRLDHWTLYRRYRDFYKLHKSLLRTHPSVAAVEFPPKKHFGNMNVVFVEERRQQLQIYLLNLVEMLPQVEACKSKLELQKAFPFFRER